MNKKICVIACGVLAVDLKRISKKLKNNIDFIFLQAGLHETPGELRLELQQAIDQISQKDKYQRIAIGYGICGRGTVGLKAGKIPLAIPRVHDCISLFLGSDKDYKKQFAKCPGTYYITDGWVEGKVEPERQKHAKNARKKMHGQPDVEEKFGKENSQHIENFLSSWQKNYRRAVYIDTGSGQIKNHKQHAKKMADQYGWRYEQLKGSMKLLQKLISAEKTDQDILIVKPGQITVFDAVSEKLNAGQTKIKTEQNHPVTKIYSKPGKKNKVRYGLGIDAGGTYTDAVIYDFHQDNILCKAKALTTKWDFTVGIEQTLCQLDRNLLEKVELVAVSTTLATNAIVEGQGQKVALILMPPKGITQTDFNHKPLGIIKGSIDISGKVIEHLDPRQISNTIKKMADQNVKAFAVSGYAASINPMHELEVKKIIRRETAAPVTCGHELSEMLNFKTRAVTAVLNAKIVPILQKFLIELSTVLQAEGIKAPVVIVKGDGSLMSVEMAMERPIETVLSGPAASVAGAGKLTQIENALVVDIGGTTTDTAAVKNSAVKICQTGSIVGGHRTHVKALDMRTKGLGGDSFVRMFENKIFIGPKRVGPISQLTEHNQNTKKAIDYLFKKNQNYALESRATAVYALSGHNEMFEPDDDEKNILQLLSIRPRSALELAKLTNAGYWGSVKLDRLTEHNIIQQFGLTVTDALHCLGEFQKWDIDAAEKMCRLVSGKTQIHDFCRQIVNRFINTLAVELFKKVLDEKIQPDEMENCNVCKELTNIWTDNKDKKNKLLDIDIKLNLPVVGIGAPVGYFVPKAAKLLNANWIIPPDADVANAIGAVTSQVVITRHCTVKPAENGFITEGIENIQKFKNFDQACEYAVEQLIKMIRKLAQKAGTHQQDVEITHFDDVITTALGSELFMGRKITGKLKGSALARISQKI